MEYVNAQEGTEQPQDAADQRQTLHGLIFRAIIVVSLTIPEPQAENTRTGFGILADPLH